MCRYNLKNKTYLTVTEWNGYMRILLSETHEKIFYNEIILLAKRNKLGKISGHSRNIFH